jgi:hypothetical protein
LFLNKNNKMAFTYSIEADKVVLNYEATSEDEAVRLSQLTEAIKCLNMAIDTERNERTDADSTLEDKIKTAVSDLIDNAPGALDTLGEISAKLGENSDVAGTILNAIADNKAAHEANQAALQEAIDNTDGKLESVLNQLTDAITAEASARTDAIQSEHEYSAAVESALAAVTGRTENLETRATTNENTFNEYKADNDSHVSDILSAINNTDTGILANANTLSANFNAFKESAEGQLTALSTTTANTVATVTSLGNEVEANKAAEELALASVILRAEDLESQMSLAATAITNNDDNAKTRLGALETRAGNLENSISGVNGISSTITANESANQGKLQGLEENKLSKTGSDTAEGTLTFNGEMKMNNYVYMGTKWRWNGHGADDRLVLEFNASDTAVPNWTPAMPFISAPTVQWPVASGNVLWLTSQFVLGLDLTTTYKVGTGDVYSIAAGDDLDDMSTSLGLGDGAGGLTYNILQNIQLPYNDPEHYVLQHVSPKTNCAYFKGELVVLSRTVDWLLHYASRPGDISSIYSTILSGTKTSDGNFIVATTTVNNESLPLEFPVDGAAADLGDGINAGDRVAYKLTSISGGLPVSIP